MNFADLKNDSIFRRIFATNPSLLQELLNDLLERTGDQTIEGIEYLPKGQLPLVAGAKLSILDVLCRDRTGAYFVVEIQLIRHPGFINRVVYNACKAYVGQLKSGKSHGTSTDVVAISICDFEIWPHAAQKAQRRAPVPMLSRWNMAERGSGNAGLLRVQYAFLELPKLRARKPDTGASRWAWLFVHAPELTEVPADLPVVYREALALANKATFTQEELDAYEKVRDEIQQVLAIAEARWAEGEAAGFIRGKVSAILAILAARNLHVSQEVRAHIEACEDPATLDQWIRRATTAASADEIITP